jgi:fatty acid desaturase
MMLDRRHLGRTYLLVLGARLLLRAAVLIPAAINLACRTRSTIPTMRSRSRQPPHGQRAGWISRTVRPGRLDFVLGGLNYQIERHLSPYMSRAHFNPARILVRDFCASRAWVTSNA